LAENRVGYRVLWGDLREIQGFVGRSEGNTEFCGEILGKYRVLWGGLRKIQGFVGRSDENTGFCGEMRKIQDFVGTSDENTTLERHPRRWRDRY
jgi:hypothetical protein